MKNILNKWMALVACLMALVLTAGALPVTAAQSDTPTGTQEGTTIAILGADLTQEQHDALLKEFGASAQTKILTVTNEEEHQALDGVIPDEQIGTDAISSVMITFKKKGSGLNLHMTHITYVTPQSYADALTTLGITDADIQISAPFDVSGTAALTGIMKGYEDATGQTIDDDVKNAVNEEAVTTTELTNDLAEKMGTEEAEKAVTNIINNIKIEINNQNPQSEEEVEAIVRKVLEEQGITLSDEDFLKLVNLFNKMKDLNIDWANVVDIIEAKGNDLINALTNSATTAEQKSFWQNIGDFFRNLIAQIKSLFN